MRRLVVRVFDGKGHAGFDAVVTGSARPGFNDRFNRGLHVTRLDNGERTFVSRSCYRELWAFAKEPG